MHFLRLVLFFAAQLLTITATFANDIVLNGALDVPVWDIRISSDEKIAAFIYRNGFLEIFERGSGKAVTRAHLPGVYSRMPAQFSFSPDLDILAYCTESGFPVIFRFPFTSNRIPPMSAEAAGCRSAAISADGSRLYVLAERQLKVFSAARMKLQHTHDLLTANQNPVDAVFCVGDKIFLSDADGNLFTLDEATSAMKLFMKHGSLFSPKGHRATIAWLIATPAGDHYLSADSKGYSLVWNPEGKVIDYVSAFVPFISAAASASGFGSCEKVNLDFRDYRKLLTCMSDRGTFAGSGAGARRAYGDAILSMVFTNGRLAVTVLHEQTIKLFAMDASGNFTLKPVDTFLSDTQFVAAAKNGELGVIKNDNYYVFDAAARKVRTDPVTVSGYTSGSPNDLRFWNSTGIFVIDPETASSRRIASLQNADFMPGEKVSANHRTSAYVRKQGSNRMSLLLRKLDAAGDSREIFTAPEIQDFAFRKDMILVGNGNAELVVLDQDGKSRGEKWSLTNANPHYPVRLYTCPQGNRTVAIENNLATVYDPDGKVRATKVLHAAEVSGVFFSPDCSAMVTSGNDSMVKLWKLPSLEPAGALLFSAGGWAFASTDGYYEGEGGALDKIHFRVNRDAVSLADFDESLRRKGLLRNSLRNIGSSRASAAAPVLAGKIFSMKESGIVFSGERLNMGQKIFVIISGKKHYGRVTFPMHTSARIEFDDKSVEAQIKAGTPVYR